MLLQDLNASSGPNSKHNVAAGWRLRKIICSHYTRAERKRMPNVRRRLISVHESLILMRRTFLPPRIGTLESNLATRSNFGPSTVRDVEYYFSNNCLIPVLSGIEIINVVLFGT